MKEHKHAEQNSLVSIGTNLLLFILKLWAGIVSMSVTLLADAWHTLSDSISSLIVLIAIRVSRKPPDEDHPYGHGRSEMIASVVVGSMLGFIALHFFFESIHRLVVHESAIYGKLALWVTILSILIKEGLAQFTFYTARRTGSKALKADAWHHRSDAFSSVIVLIGIMLNDYFWWMDGLLGIGISVFIAIVAYGILKEAVYALLGQNPGDSIETDVAGFCDEVAAMKVYAHHVHVHEYGDHREMVFHIRLPKDWNLERVHDLVNDLEEAVESHYDVNATIHVDPLAGERNNLD